MQSAFGSGKICMHGSKGNRIASKLEKYTIIHTVKTQNYVD
jgi:hypothetical protein